MTNSVEGCRARNMKKLFMDISGNYALHFPEPALFRRERNSKTSSRSLPSENETPTLRASCKGLNVSGDW